MIQIVKMEPCHVAQVAKLEKLCFSDPWSERSVAGELTNPLSLWLVAVDDGKVVGYVGSQTVMGEADMMNVAVDPRYRRGGVGQALILSLIDALIAHDCYQLTLEVRASNREAISLYQKLGFAQVGRRPNYYRNPKEDACILRKEWTL